MFKYIQPLSLHKCLKWQTATINCTRLGHFSAGKSSLDTIADKGGSLKVSFSQGNSEGSIYKPPALVDIEKVVLVLWPFESHLLIIDSN